VFLPSHHLSHHPCHLMVAVAPTLSPHPHLIMVATHPSPLHLLPMVVVVVAVANRLPL
jgi:hypothetical protein